MKRLKEDGMGQSRLATNNRDSVEEEALTKHVQKKRPGSYYSMALVKSVMLSRLPLSSCMRTTIFSFPASVNSSKIPSCLKRAETVEPTERADPGASKTDGNGQMSHW